MLHLRNLFSALSVLVIAAGLFVSLQVSAKPAVPTVKTVDPSTPAPATPLTPAVPDAPATPAPVATPAAPAKDTAPVRAKLIDATDVSTSALSKGSIDVYMSLEDGGKLDDALVNAETTLSDKITLVTVKDKKETEGPLRVELPMSKKVKLTSDDKFMRISGIEKSLKDGDKFQLILHFMRAPNVTVDVTVHKKSSFF